MAERRTRHTWHYRPGEMVVAMQVPEEMLDRNRLHATVRDAVEKYLAGNVGGVFHSQQRRQEPIIFRANDRPPLVFLFYDLGEPEAHDFVKQVVHATHAEDLAAFSDLRNAGMTPVGVMPHWLGSAQQDFGDGSPATLPRSAKPPVDGEQSGRWRFHYKAVSRALNRSARSKQAGVAPVQAAILDTHPDWTRVRKQAARFRDQNAQLDELVNFVGDPGLSEWHSRALEERNREGLRLAHRSRRHDVSDHALFVAGLIHDLAPSSRLHFRPVLNRFGVGDLHLLLLVLQDLLETTARQGPLVLNMSFGFLPKLEYLPWIWNGVDPPNDPGFIADVPIRGQARDRAWIARNRIEVDRTVRLLHSGIGQLAAYLLANNCLAVAAAGNDSLARVESGRPRFGPRVPARYESVLGVAATTRDASTAAEYSNVGDELEAGDHIAVFGGGVDPAADEPRDGVIGVYTHQEFPQPAGSRAHKVPNEWGWAEWSGTSFSTAIASGLVIRYWSTGLAERPDLSAEDVLLEFHREARDFAPGVRTPSIPMQGDWERLSSG